jgi:hypothetical protein
VVHIIVNNGVLTLEGQVDSEGDKNIAEIQAKGVQGAFSVGRRPNASWEAARFFGLRRILARKFSG